MGEIVAVRRNLTPGAVFYTQIGREVYSSLDRVNWTLAWTFPDGPQVSEGVSDSTTVTNVYSIEQNSYPLNLTVNNVTNGDWPVSTSQLDRNLCGASLAATAVFLGWLDAANEGKHDGFLSDLGIVANTGAVITGAAAFILGFFTGGGAWVAWLGGMSVGFAGSSAITDWVATADNVEDLKTEENIKAIACAVREAMLVPGAGRTAFKNALYGADGITQNAAAAWEQLVDMLPNFYTTFLTMVTEAPSSACICDGCYDLPMIDAASTNGILMRGNRMVSKINRHSYLPSNWKFLSIAWDIPLCQVDKVEFELLVNTHVTQSGLTWGTHYFMIVAISGPFSQSSTQTLIPPAWTAGHSIRTFDFSGVTLAHGVNRISVDYRVVYASTAGGQNSLDPTAQVSFNRASYCEREV